MMLRALLLLFLLGVLTPSVQGQRIRVQRNCSKLTDDDLWLECTVDQCVRDCGWGQIYFVLALAACVIALTAHIRKQITRDIETIGDAKKEFEDHILNHVGHDSRAILENPDRIKWPKEEKKTASAFHRSSTPARFTGRRNSQEPAQDPSQPTNDPNQSTPPDKQKGQTLRHYLIDVRGGRAAEFRAKLSSNNKKTERDRFIDDVNAVLAEGVLSKAATSEIGFMGSAEPQYQSSPMNQYTPAEDVKEFKSTSAEEFKQLGVFKDSLEKAIGQGKHDSLKRCIVALKTKGLLTEPPSQDIYMDEEFQLDNFDTLAFLWCSPSIPADARKPSTLPMNVLHSQQVDTLLLSIMTKCKFGHKSHTQAQKSLHKLLRVDNKSLNIDGQGLEFITADLLKEAGIEKMHDVACILKHLEGFKEDGVDASCVGSVTVKDDRDAGGQHSDNATTSICHGNNVQRALFVSSLSPLPFVFDPRMDKEEKQSMLWMQSLPLYMPVTSIRLSFFYSSAQWYVRKPAAAISFVILRDGKPLDTWEIGPPSPQQPAQVQAMYQAPVMGAPPAQLTAQNGVAMPQASPEAQASLSQSMPMAPAVLGRDLPDQGPAGVTLAPYSGVEGQTSYYEQPMYSGMEGQTVYYEQQMAAAGPGLQPWQMSGPGMQPWPMQPDYYAAPGVGVDASQWPQAVMQPSFGYPTYYPHSYPPEEVMFDTSDSAHSDRPDMLKLKKFMAKTQPGDVLRVFLKSQKSEQICVSNLRLFVHQVKQALPAVTLQCRGDHALRLPLEADHQEPMFGYILRMCDECGCQVIGGEGPGLLCHECSYHICETCSVVKHWQSQAQTVVAPILTPTFEMSWVEFFQRDSPVRPRFSDANLENLINSFKANPAMKEALTIAEPLELWYPLHALMATCHMPTEGHHKLMTAMIENTKDSDVKPQNEKNAREMYPLHLLICCLDASHSWDQSQKDLMKKMIQDLKANSDDKVWNACSKDSRLALVGFKHNLEVKTLKDYYKKVQWWSLMETLTGVRRGLDGKKVADSEDSDFVGLIQLSCARPLAVRVFSFCRILVPILYLTACVTGLVLGVLGSIEKNRTHRDQMNSVIGWAIFPAPEGLIALLVVLAQFAESRHWLHERLEDGGMVVLSVPLIMLISFSLGLWGGIRWGWPPWAAFFFTLSLAIFGKGLLLAFFGFSSEYIDTFGHQTNIRKRRLQFLSTLTIHALMVIRVQSISDAVASFADAVCTEQCARYEVAVYFLAAVVVLGGLAMLSFWYISWVVTDIVTTLLRVVNLSSDDEAELAKESVEHKVAKRVHSWTIARWVQICGHLKYLINVLDAIKQLQVGVLIAVASALISIALTAIGETVMAGLE